jgi:hypothetical protein
MIYTEWAKINRIGRAISSAEPFLGDVGMLQGWEYE